MAYGLEDETREELDRLARERQIEGRSNMDRDELVKALEKSYDENPPPEPRIG